MAPNLDLVADVVREPVRHDLVAIPVIWLRAVGVGVVLGPVHDLILGRAFIGVAVHFLALVGTICWSGDLLVMDDEHGFRIAVLYRSDGKIRDGVTTYTYWACLAIAGTEVARRTSLVGAANAVLEWQPTAPR